MATRKKEEIVTFKVDRALWRAMRGVENRSEFIRAAILTALDSVCPLCKGSGILTPDQRRHWDRFAKTHPLAECGDCHAMHLVCEVGDEAGDKDDSDKDGDAVTRRRGDAVNVRGRRRP